MELPEHLRFLRGNAVLILLPTALVLCLAALATALATPSYVARAEVFVSAVPSSNPSDFLTSLGVVERQLPSYAQLATRGLVLEGAASQLGDTTAQQLAAQVTTELTEDTTLIGVVGRDQDPARAAAMANAVAVRLGAVIEDYERPEGGASPVRVTTVEAAVTPSRPSTPNLRLNLLIGGIVGVTLGLGLAVARRALGTADGRPGRPRRRITRQSPIGASTPDEPLLDESLPR